VNHGRLLYVQAEDIVHYDKQWLENVVKEVAMANPRWGCGQLVLYDNVIIQEHLVQTLVTGKAHLDAVSSQFSADGMYLGDVGIICLSI